MTAFSSEIEIGTASAREMVGRGSRLVWVLGPMDPRRHATLQEITPNVYSVGFEEIMGSKKPERLVGKAPVLVCEHGITSLFLAKKLRSEGIEAFSIEGGVDEMMKW